MILDLNDKSVKCEVVFTFMGRYAICGWKYEKSCVFIKQNFYFSILLPSNSFDVEFVS